MKEPKTSNKKKATIFKILWYLIKYTNKSSPAKVTDINNYLSSCGMKLDVKTINEDINLLNELEIGVEICHLKNKGYYVSKRFIDESYRNILIDLIKNNKILGKQEEKELLTIITGDLNFEKQKQYLSYEFYEEEKANLVKNLEIIEEAIKEIKDISFEYLSFDKKGKLKKDKVIYTVMPSEIKFIEGIYYLYYSRWGNQLSIHESKRIKIQYMTNVRKIKRRNNAIILASYPKRKQNDCTFSFEVEILYEWAIELINECFDDYKPTYNRTRTFYRINTTREKAMDWAKMYGKYFIINNEEIRNFLVEEAKKTIEYLCNGDIIKQKIKSAVINYYNDNLNFEKNEPKQYFKNLKLSIDDYLYDIGYKYVDIFNDVLVYKGNNEKVLVKILGLDTYTFYSDSSANLSNKEVRTKDFEKLISEFEVMEAEQKYLIEFADGTKPQTRIITQYEKIRLSLNPKAYFQELRILKVK